MKINLKPDTINRSAAAKHFIVASGISRLTRGEFDEVVRERHLQIFPGAWCDDEACEVHSYERAKAALEAARS